MQFDSGATISYNTGTGTGGAIYIESASRLMFASNATITHNRAGPVHYAGGFYADAASTVNFTRYVYVDLFMILLTNYSYYHFLYPPHSYGFVVSPP